MLAKKKTWYAATVTVDSEAVEAVEFGLSEAGAEGTEIEMFGQGSRSAETVVKGYSSQKFDAGALRAALIYGLAVHGFTEAAIRNIDLYDVEDEDWLAEWKKHWKPTEIGRFIVAPPWEAIAETEKIVIRIEPNMAFGTGTHDTTKLCLKAIGELYRPGQTVLDVGTGTGILAIAAAKLGAKSVFACDTDVDAIKIARENAVLNETGWIEFTEGEIAADAPVCDFVFANLTVDVIVPMLDLLLAKTRSILLLSGILVEQKDMIVAALQKSGISNFSFETSGEWVSIVVRTSVPGKE